MTSTPRAVLALPVLVLVSLLAGCGGGGADSSTASDSGGSSVGSRGLATAADRAQEPASGSKAATTATLSREVISTGSVTLRSTSLDRARAEVFRLVASWGGSVADEQSTSDRQGRVVDSTLTLRVPTATFSRAMDALARVGAVQEQSRTSEDVTTRVLDNDARVSAAERSIRQIVRLLDRAEKLSDVIAIESDLARRQADLDSLRSQQAWLSDQTSLSTITVHLDRTTNAAPREETRGFLAGLENGWDALGGGTLLVLTAAGAALPFVAVVVLLGVPVLVVVRRRASAASAPARSA